MNRFIKRGTSALAVTAVSFVLTAGVAGASGPSPIDDGPRPDVFGSIEQTASNSNSTNQRSSADASSQQKNLAGSLSVLSLWSDNGDVRQSNKAWNTAVSGNANSTDQSIRQGAWQQVEGDGGADHPKPHGPKPHGPKPTPMPTYSMPNTPAGGHPQGVIDQSASNTNGTTQKSQAHASSKQANLAPSLSILTLGTGNGDVHQSNKASNTALSGNANTTDQRIHQGAWQQVKEDGKHGYDPKPHDPKPHEPKPHEPKPHEPKPHEPKPHEPEPHGPKPHEPKPDHGCGCDQPKPHEPKPYEPKPDHDYDNGGTGSISQDAGNSNETTQQSKADASSKQANVNLPISVLGIHTNNGDVDQSNSAHNTAVSGNANSTDQSIGQTADQQVEGDGSNGKADGKNGKPGKDDKGGGKVDGAEGTIDQAANNSNTTEQQSSADASSKQANVNLPISILSVGSNNGDVDQSNSAKNTAVSGNANSTDQGVHQGAEQQVDDGGKADTSQQASNDNSTDQRSKADASSSQLNINAPISILSAGSNNGDVDQSNQASNGAGSANGNGTSQMIGQLVDQGG